MQCVAAELQTEIEQFLNYEASLLEENKFREWLGLIADDVVYRLPVRRAVQPGTADDGAAFCLYDDDKKSLEMRTMRLETGAAHTEIPWSVTQRLITNILVRSQPRPDEIHVSSNFMVYQERLGRYAMTFIGKRLDRLRRSGGRLQIARRDIELAQTVLPATISLFF